MGSGGSGVLRAEVGLDVGAPGRTPRVLVAPTPRAWLGARHCRMGPCEDVFQARHFCSKLGNKISVYFSLIFLSICFCFCFLRKSQEKVLLKHWETCLQSCTTW